MADGKPKLCANCGKLMGVADECPYCGADNRKVSVRLKRVANSSEAGASVTATIIGINLFFFAAALMVGGIETARGGMEIIAVDSGVLFRMGSQFNPAVDAGQWWRVITPIFLHMGLLHVVFNNYVLWWGGRVVEEDIGGRFMLLTYLLSGIIGFVASYFADIGGAGASGAVSGMIGFVFVRRYLQDGHLRHPDGRQAMLYTLLMGVMGLVVAVNNVAHAFGWISGAAMAGLLSKVRLGRGGAVALMLLTWTLTGVTLVAAALMAVNLGNGSSADFETATGCLQRHVIPVADSTAKTLTGKAIDDARACVGDIKPLESEANASIDAIAAGLKTLAQAYEEGDSGGLSRGLDAVRAGSIRWLEWRAEAYPRYPRFL